MADRLAKPAVGSRPKPPPVHSTTSSITRRAIRREPPALTETVRRGGRRGRARDRLTSAGQSGSRRATSVRGRQAARWGCCDAPSALSSLNCVTWAVRHQRRCEVIHGEDSRALGEAAVRRVSVRWRSRYRATARASWDSSARKVMRAAGRRCRVRRPRGRGRKRGRGRRSGRCRRRRGGRSTRRDRRERRGRSGEAAARRPLSSRPGGRPGARGCPGRCRNVGCDLPAPA